jgi:hypothetical protein
MNADLEALVATAVRDGFTIESQTATCGTQADADPDLRL